MHTITDYKQLNIKNAFSNIHSVKNRVIFNGHNVKHPLTTVVYVIGLYALSVINVKAPYSMLNQ